MGGLLDSNLITPAKQLYSSYLEVSLSNLCDVIHLMNDSVLTEGVYLHLQYDRDSRKEIRGGCILIEKSWVDVNTIGDNKNCSAAH